MDKKQLQRTVEVLEENLRNHEKQARLLRKAIDSYQKMCTHKWEDGSEAWVEQTGMNYHIRTCVICGKTEDLR